MTRPFLTVLAFTAIVLPSLAARPASGVTIAFFNDGAYVDVPDEAAKLNASLNAIGGHTINSFTGVAAAAFTTALAGADTLVIPELQNGDLYAGMDDDARDVVREFVRSGGDIVITSQVTFASNLINGLFGKTVTSGTAGNTTLNAADALGTIFENGPASLTAPSAVQGVSTASLPSFALSIYQNVSGGTTVFVFPEDAGSVIYLGFDWFATPTDADWQTVLGLALNFESNVWDGSSDGLWSTDANWTTDAAPGSGERVVFAGSANTTVNHDQLAGTTYAAITFASNADAFTITGNAIGLANGANVTNRSANVQTFDADLQLSNAAATVTADTAGFAFNGDVTLVGGSSSLTVTGSHNTAIAGDVTGSGSLVKSGSGTLTLTGENNYSGGTTVSAGTLAGNTASLQGDIANNASVVFNQAAAGTYAGQMTGSGSLTKSGAGVLTLSGNNNFSGGVTINAGGIVLDHANAAGTGNVTLNAGSLVGAATIGGDLLVAGGSLRPGASIGTLNVGGTFTLNGGTWEVELDNAGHSDRIVADDAVLTSGTLLATPTEAITGPQSYTILQTTTGIAGDPANLTQSISNSAWLLEYSLEISGNDLLLIVAQAPTSVVDAVAPLGKPNLHDIAAIFDHALDNNLGGPQVAQLQNLTQAQLQQVVEQSRPQIQQAGNMVVRNQQRAVTASLSSRQQSMQQALRNVDRVREGHRLADAGPDTPAFAQALRAIDDAIPPLRAWTPWARSLNDWGDLEGDAFSSGYDWHTHGFDAGAEALVREDVLIGASVAALWSNLGGDGGSGSADITTLYASLYASYLTRNWHVDGGLTYGHAWTDNSRPVTPLGLVAEGDYESNIFGVYLGGGYVFRVGAWDVEPTLYYEYTHVADDGYTETGAGAFNQTVHDNGTDSLRQSVGVRVARAFDGPGPGTMRARFAAAWEHEFLDNQVVSSVDLLGGTFTGRGVDVSRDTAKLSAGLDWMLTDAVTLFADYTASINEDWHNHSANVGLRLDF